MKLYDTLSGTTEPFSPDGVVKMYVCGMTPYLPPHVGHAMRAVVFDVIRRYLEFRGHSVEHVENFTDIDDKMIAGARRLGVALQELADENIRVYLEEMDSLNVLRAHHYPRATEEIPRIVEMITALVEMGAAYAVDGDVYFRVRWRESYGKLSHRSLDSMMAGARVEVDEAKEDLMDFALWKSRKPGEPYWESPWGPGRPGWHIECSAMSIKYLGPCVDIHGGGQDLVFPHHENEIAQTESYTKTEPMARFWVHNGLMRSGADKMSKSLGNFVMAGEALRQYSADALRLFFLSSHYRSPLTYSDEGVSAQERAVGRLRNATIAAQPAQSERSLDAATYIEHFNAAMDDDINTPRAIAVLFDLAHEVNRSSEERVDVTGAQATLRELAGVLGLTLAAPLDHSAAEVGPLVELLIETRQRLRTAKQYELADELRARLTELGYSLEDTPSGTQWQRMSP